MKGKRAARAPYPTDPEAHAGAQTRSKPANLEEQAQEAESMRKRSRQPEPDDTADPTDPEAPVLGAGEGTQPIPAEPPAGAIARLAAAMTTGFCGFCNGPALPDHRKTHKCARCRRDKIGA